MSRKNVALGADEIGIGQKYTKTGMLLDANTTTSDTRKGMSFE